MSQWLKQSTAATVVLGPFVDSSDGVTAETGLTISQTDIRLSKNGGAFAQTNNAAGATHMENGYYSAPLDTTDTNTLGRLRVAVTESGALPVWADFHVVPANVWDSLFGSDKLQVDAVEISSDTATADAVQANIGNLDQAVSSRSTLSGSQVNAEVVDVLTVDTLPELSQAQPAATPTFRTAVMLLYMALRNKLTQTSSQMSVHDNAGTVICKSATSDDGTTFTRDTLASGP
jgi:hypothetical protein